MDDVLYKVSAKKILTNDLVDLDEKLEEIDLPYDSDLYYQYRWY